MESAGKHSSGAAHLQTTRLQRQGVSCEENLHLVYCRCCTHMPGLWDKCGEPISSWHVPRYSPVLLGSSRFSVHAWSHSSSNRTGVSAQLMRKIFWLRICEKQPNCVSLSNVLSRVALQRSFLQATASVSASNSQICHERTGKTMPLSRC